MSIERNPLSPQNQTLRSYRVYISPTKWRNNCYTYYTYWFPETYWFNLLVNLL